MRIASRAVASLLAVTTIVASPAAAEEQVRFDDHTVVRVQIETMRDIRTLLAIGGDIWSESIGFGAIDVMLPTERVGVLDRAGLEHEIVIPEVQSLLDSERARLQAAGEGGIAGGGFFDDYRPREELLDFYDALAAARPDLVSSRVIGTSTEGRPIRAFTICGGDADTLPAIYVNTGAHAREWIAPATIAYFADALVNGHGVDFRITQLVDEVCWYIVPMANPDGYEYSWSTNRLWRKTRSDNGDGTFGVDWNRNFSAGWGGPGSSGSTSSDIYRGTAAFSEPETQAIRDDVLARENIAIFLDIHCYSQLVLWPYGYANGEPAGEAGDIHRAIGEGISEAIRSVNGENFTPQPGYELYLASGTSPDWAWDEAGAYSFTYELRDTGEFGFILPPDQIVPSGEEILESLLWTGEQVLGAVQASFPDGVPTIVTPFESTASQVRLNSIFATLDSTTAMLRTRIDGGVWETTAMSALGNDLYAFELPAAACGRTIDFEFTVRTVQGAEILARDGGAPWTAIALENETPIEDDVESDLGWSLADASDTATTGRWVRGDPNGTAAQPEDDATPGAGTQCFFTGQGSIGGGLGEADVDGGTTTLTSPVIDLPAGTESATIACNLWYSNDTGAAPDSDSMPIEYRLDTGSWQPLDEITTSAATWRPLDWDVDLAGGSSLQVRFIASDLGDGSVVEAAIDDFRVVVTSCGDAPCPADLNGDGSVGGADLGLLLAAWGPCAGCPEDLNGDGVVNGADIGLLLASWGNCF